MNCSFSFADCYYNDASPFYLYLYIQVPVRVAGGLLFELLGQSAGDPFKEEDDIPIVLRSWHAQRFLVTSLHVKGSASNINVLGIAEVQVCSCLIKECYVLGLANLTWVHQDSMKSGCGSRFFYITLSSLPIRTNGFTLGS